MDNKRIILQKTLGSRFDINNFKLFSAQFFNNDNLNIKDGGRSTSIWPAYTDYIESYSEIGVYKDPERNTLTILAVELKKSKAVDRARSMQRNFVAKYLEANNFDAALVAFYNGDVDEGSWRLSFVRLDYTFTEKGIKLELTPARRYSYLVGENEPNHTAQAQLLPIFEDDDISPTLDSIEGAFSVERITKGFFEQYREKYLELMEYLENDKEFIDESKNLGLSPAKFAEQFAKKLMGQLAFLYFLQKKGWLGVRKEWGDGDRRFIRNLFNRSIQEKKGDFFNEYLEPLFYEALNRKREGQFYERFGFKIPFLNGGLFEPIEGYNWKSVRLYIPDSIFSNADEKGRNADGILDIFDRYNFTINEDEPLEKEVAVDPEMLGKIFENLLDVKDRKSKGAFYTPREIVHYMCRESLVNYLVNKAGVPYNDMKEFILYGELIRDADNRSGGGSKGLIIKKTVLENIVEIDNALRDIRVADPAVGSGAFPLGMLNEIVKARNNITEYIIMKNNEGALDRVYDEKYIRRIRSSYQMKWDTIKNCIFAVDIEPSAVDIAKLRLWLSIVVEQEIGDEIQEPHPLPNLDCNIMIGNSLVDEYEGIKLFDETILLKNSRLKEKGKKNKKKLSVQMSWLIDHTDEMLKEMFDLQDRFFGEENEERKKEMKGQIDRIREELIEYKLTHDGNDAALKKFRELEKKKIHPYFLWELEFAKVFKEQRGFDIVIGNPPYVDYRKIDSITKEGIKDFETFKVTKTASLYVYFIELGYDLLNDKGTLVFINPYQYLTAESGYGLRKLMVPQKAITRIVDVSNIRVFESASTYTCINVFSQIDNDEGIIMTYRPDDIEKLEVNEKSLSYADIKEKDQYTILLNPNAVVRRVDMVKNKLVDCADVFCGTSMTGFRKSVISSEEYNPGDTRYAPLLESSNIQKYDYELVSYIDKSIYPKNVQKAFEENENLFLARMTKRVRVCRAEKGFYCGKVNCITNIRADIDYLTAILNSKLIDYYYITKNESKHLSGGYLGFDIPSVEAIPIPSVDVKEQNKFADLVENIYLNAGNDDVIREIRGMVDEMVYRLYKLTPEEIEVVEGFFGDM